MTGTIIAAIAIVIIPLFFNYRILFLIIIVLWVGGCLYLSLMDRTPHSVMTFPGQAFLNSSA